VTGGRRSAQGRDTSLLSEVSLSPILAGCRGVSITAKFPFTGFRDRDLAVHSAGWMCHDVAWGARRFTAMLKKLLGVMMVLMISVGFALADEAKGKFKKMAKGTITVTVGDKDVEYKVNFKETKVFNGDDELKGKEKGKFFKDLKEGTEVTVTYDKDGNKATELKFKK
jgi:hypothetical protein